MKKQNSTRGAKQIPRRVLFFHWQNETFREISSKNEIFTRRRGNNNVIPSRIGISLIEAGFGGTVIGGPMAYFETTRAYYKSDHKSLSLAQKTKASFHGALKAQEEDVAEVAADGDLDFSDFDFDDFDDLGTYDADAGTSCSSSIGPPPAPVLPALPEVVPKI